MVRLVLTGFLMALVFSCVSSTPPAPPQEAVETYELDEIPLPEPAPFVPPQAEQEPPMIEDGPAVELGKVYETSAASTEECVKPLQEATLRNLIKENCEMVNQKVERTKLGIPVAFLFFECQDFRRVALLKVVADQETTVSLGRIKAARKVAECSAPDEPLGMSVFFIDTPISTDKG